MGVIVYTVAEVAEMLGVSRSTVRAMVSGGELSEVKSAKTGRRIGRQIRIPAFCQRLNAMLRTKGVKGGRHQMGMTDGEAMLRLAAIGLNTTMP